MWVEPGGMAGEGTITKRHTVVVVQCGNVSAHTSGKRGREGDGVRDGAWLSN